MLDLIIKDNQTNRNWKKYPPLLYGKKCRNKYAAKNYQKKTLIFSRELYQINKEFPQKREVKLAHIVLK